MNSVKIITISKPIRDTIKYLSNERTVYLIYDGILYVTNAAISSDQITVMKSSNNVVYVTKDGVYVDNYIFLRYKY